MEPGGEEPATGPGPAPSPDEQAARREALRELAALIGQEVFYRA